MHYQNVVERCPFLPAYSRDETVDKAAKPNPPPETTFYLFFIGFNLSDDCEIVHSELPEKFTVRLKEKDPLKGPIMYIM